MFLEIRGSRPAVFFKTSQVSQESICDVLYFCKACKALIPATVLKRTPSQVFSSEYTFLNIFANCFISIDASLLEQIRFQKRLIFVK